MTFVWVVGVEHSDHDRPADEVAAFGTESAAERYVRDGNAATGLDTAKHSRGGVDGRLFVMAGPVPFHEDVPAVRALHTALYRTAWVQEWIDAGRLGPTSVPAEIEAVNEVDDPVGFAAAVDALSFANVNDTDVSIRSGNPAAVNAEYRRRWTAQVETTQGAS